MKNSVRKFIKSLPGPKSYCDCNKLCSSLEIEHVVPIYLLNKNKKNNYKNYKKSINDPHNLYVCCREINRKKGTRLVGKEFYPDKYEGMLARSSLYMNWKYDLSIDALTLDCWEIMDWCCGPKKFEHDRNKIIQNKTGDINPFISNHKS